MSVITASTSTGGASRRGLSASLWIVQILLGVAFFTTGTMKLTQPLELLAANMPWVTASPAWLARFIGVAELAGAIGLVLPSVTRVAPRLTSLAAIGLVIIMVLASCVHLSRGEVGILPATFLLAGLAAFVAWGRGVAVPIVARSR